MSRKNKVNPDHYVQRGRLTPDEAARERVKQREVSSPSPTEGKSQGFQTRKPRVTGDDPAAPPETDAAAADKPDADTRTDKRAV